MEGTVWTLGRTERQTDELTGDRRGWINGNMDEQTDGHM